MLPKPEVIQILSHATVFACPSVYEPMGIVNLEAMACEARGRRDRDGRHPRGRRGRVTGLLVPYEPRPDGTGTPVDPDALAAASPPASTSYSPTGRAERWASPAAPAPSTGSAGTSPPPKRCGSTNACSLNVIPARRRRA